jgi:hypothetical protein
MSLLHSFLHKDKRSCGEMASSHVVIDVVIFQSGGCAGNKKSPGKPARAGVVV